MFDKKSLVDPTFLLVYHWFPFFLFPLALLINHRKLSFSLDFINKKKKIKAIDSISSSSKACTIHYYQ